MPFKSSAQRKFMYAAAARGEIPQSTVSEFSKATPKNKKLPEHVGNFKRLKEKMGKK